MLRLWKKSKTKKKLLNDCFQLFIQDLRHLQHELTKNFQNNNFLHNKFIVACRDVLICRFACYKPFDTMIELINNTRSFILTFNKIHQTKTFFTNRRFHENKRSHNDNRNMLRFRYQFRYQSCSQSRYGQYNQSG